MAQSNHDFIERKVGWLIVFTLMTVSVGGLVEIVPLFHMKSTTTPVEGLKPYDPVRLVGRDIYIREGCYNCHSQMIRPFRAETERYGHYSVAGEYVYDHPFQWGSKRTGPDLHRVGGRYSDQWHRIHLLNPRDVVPESNMPAFPWLDRPAKIDDIEAKMTALRKVGVPYSDEEIQGARKALEGKTELEAVIAYLQGLGTALNAGKPAAPAVAAAAPAPAEAAAAPAPEEGKTGICLNVNPARPGAAYGYVDMGGWKGGQAEYVMVPYADFNLLKFPDRDQAMEKIRDLTMLSDIFPTGYHGAVTAGVTTGSTVYVAGAGPVGLACAASAQLLGAAVVIVGDMIPERLAQARSFGCETIDLKKGELVDQLAQLLGEPLVDAAVDCVGFEARGHGAGAGEAPATVLNDVMTVARAGASIGIPGLYVTGDPGGIDANAKVGQLGIRIGLGWAKSHSFTTGQCPVMRYHRQLMMAILNDKVQIAKAVNATVITLDQAPQGYKDFDKGAARKFVLDPHGMVAAAA